MAFPFDIVGFDLDGTLVDTSADLAAAVNHALGLAGRPSLSVDEVRPMIGGGGKAMLANAMAATGGFSEGELDAAYRHMLAYNDAHIADESRAFEGLVDALDALAAMGVKAAVVTNKHEARAVKLLTALDLIDRFVTVIGGDTMGPGNAKPSPVPIIEMIRRCGGGRAAFVGDSIYDVGAARNAGIPCVAVSFGFLDRPVEALGADAVIGHFGELIGVLAGVISPP